MSFGHLFAVAACLASLAGAAAAEDAAPLAGLQPSDLTAAGIGGDWSPAMPDFSGLMGNSPDAGAYAYSSLFDWRDGGASTIDATVQTLADDAAAVAAMARLEAYDRRVFGEVTGSADLGDGGRLMSDAGTLVVRWRAGRHVIRVGSFGPRPLSRDRLLALAAGLTPQVARLSGSAATSDPLLRLLPAGSEALPVLGSASGPYDWWVWAHDRQGDHPSARLRRLLKEGVGDGHAVMRSYAVPALPGHYATVTLVPFRDRPAALRYMRASAPSGTRVAPQDFTIQPPDPRQLLFVWRADVVVGRHAVEIDCQSERGGINPGCRDIVRGLAGETISTLSSTR